MDDLRDKVLQEIDELRAFADSDIHPIASPDNWDVYSELCDLIDEVKESFLSMPEAHEPNNHDWINVKNRMPKQPPVIHSRIRNFTGKTQTTQSR